jgi:exonuclease SbcC
MIRRIELVNFMSHEHTVLEPSDGLTVLVGPNNCGKSAVVTALQILAHNENSTYVMRHGAQETSITVWTDDGHEIEWRRKKSGGPSYAVDGRLFDRLGGSVPEEVRRALRLEKVSAGGDGSAHEFDLHFGEQKSPVFLIDGSAQQAAQFFASSSDAAKLVQMQARHREKVRDAKRDRQTAREQAEALEETLSALEPVSAIEAALATAEALHAEIVELENRMSAAADIASRIRVTAGEAERAQAEAAALEAIAEPPALADTAAAARLIADLRRVAAERERAVAVRDAAAGVPAPPELSDPAGLERLAARIAAAEREALRQQRRAAVFEALAAVPQAGDTGALSELTGRLSRAAEEVSAAERAVSAADDALKEAGQELRRVAAAQGTCPTCGAELDPDRLVDAAARGVGGGHGHGA